MQVMQIENNIKNESSDNIIKRNRPSKEQRYQKEREELIQKINSIIGIDDIRNSVYLYDLENNEILKEKLRELSETEIKKYYKCGTWSYYTRNKKDVLVLLRNIYKDDGYEITMKQKTIERNNKKMRNTLYYFNKINI